MPIIKINDLDLHFVYEIAEFEKKKIDLVLVHGMSVDLRFWDYITPRFVKSGYNVLRYDLRGHGKSSVPKSGYSLIRRISDLKLLLDHLKITSVILIGHSLGGTVATSFTTEYPEYVTGLCLIDGYISGYRPEAGSPIVFNAGKIARETSVKEAMRKFRETGIFDLLTKSKEVHNLLDTIQEDHPGGFWLDDGTIVDSPFNTIEKLDKIPNIPILCLIGEFDFNDFHEMAKIIKEKLLQTVIEEITGSKHMGPMDNPQEVYRIIENWIRTFN